MSLWGKKETPVNLSEKIATHTDALKQKIADLEVRISTVENSSNKREQLAYQELNNQIISVKTNVKETFVQIQQQIEEIKQTTHTLFTQQQKTIEELQTKYEERFAAIETKLKETKPTTVLQTESNAPIKSSPLAKTVFEKSQGNSFLQPKTKPSWVLKKKTEEEEEK
jgi:hypothetical protein